ncbi:GlxA family transcriptional regulator [Duganella callida]|uniref:Helix-turn-helix domain-containing protein n=1 Tax=Duganella callida TaxID=2561932 RepID=A0A4Y9SFR0_9BURK|nr:helix-turn-helix domain-containing protein [Duganella callida]TFW19964.1 helix-turn-helix domain-containing protein [Duganella callida]
MSTSALKDLKVVVIAFDQMSPFHLSVPCLVFGEDRRMGEAPWFALRVCAGEAGQLRTTAGFSIHCTHGLEAVADADIVVIPSWRDVTEAPPAPMLQALTAAYEQGALVVGLCLGAYVVAATGLLSGQRATTHWAWAGDFARAYPDIEVDARVLYVEAGRLLTSAGVAAGIDCCMHVVSRVYGRNVANALARRLVVPPQREGGQAQFIEQPLPQHANDERLSFALDWVRANLHQPLPIDAVAARIAMSRRTFTRHFKQLTGTTYGAWLVMERVKLVQRQLETTDQTIEVIAAACGFGTSTSLRQHFFAALGVTPAAYRRTFQLSQRKR